MAPSATLKGEARASPFLPPEAAPVAVPAAFALDADLGADKRLALRDLTVTVPAGRLAAAGTADLETEALDLKATSPWSNPAGSAPCCRPGVAWQAVRAEAGSAAPWRSRPST